MFLRIISPMKRITTIWIQRCVGLHSLTRKKGEQFNLETEMKMLKNYPTLVSKVEDISRTVQNERIEAFQLSFCSPKPIYQWEIDLSNESDNWAALAKSEKVSKDFHVISTFVFNA